MTAAGQVTSSARQVSHSDAMRGMARFGLAARAFVYLVIGWIAFQIALGHQSQQANQRGALAEVASNAGGTVLLWLLAIGFAAYAIWRLSEAVFGTAAEGNETGPRVQSGIRGVIYAALCVSTFAFIAGSSQKGQSQQQASTTAKIMKHDLGRWLVGLVGVIVVVVGVAMIVEGVKKKFLKQLRTEEMSPTQRTVVTRLGMVGTIARGIVFAMAGVLVVIAAVTYDPQKSTGLDGALRTFAQAPAGPWLLGALAIGLIAFGVYGFAMSRWAKT